MVSVLRTLQAEWNDLVPAAQALGIRRVRTLNLPLETIEYRRTKLDWLRGEINRLSQSSSLTQSTDLSSLTFGVELELLMPVGMNHHRLALEVHRAGVPCEFEGYNHNNNSHWKVVTDGSLGDYTRGAEVVSPVLRGDAGFLQLQKVCDALKSAGCKVSKKCGFHVHVGASQFQVNTFQNLVRLYQSAENAIDSFMAPSRRGASGGNGFCRTLRVNEALLDRARTVDQVAQSIGQTPGRNNARGGGRYCKLNLQSFWQHGTVEFRHHQGTVEADKALNWTRLCLRIVMAAQEGTRAASTFDALFTAVKSPDAEKAFFQGRADFFASQVDRAERRLQRAVADRTVRSYSFDERDTTRAPVPSRPVPNVFEEVGNDLGNRATTRGQI